MSSPPRLPLSFALVVVVASLTVTTLSANVAVAEEPIAPSVAVADEPQTPPVAAAEAEEALDTATAVIQPDAATEVPPSESDEIGGTLALRELALVQGDLDRQGQQKASSLLARPTAGKADEFGNGYNVPQATPLCSDAVCVHYTTTGSQAISSKDEDDNGTPDYAETVLSTVSSVHQTYIDAGYRAPKSDGNRGGDARTDIYLADIGRRGLYGYCTSDEPNRTLKRKPWDTWAYCVLDNNYSQSKFPKKSPLQNLQVTAAHEYFHAIQFGYDVHEDPWFLEATATWAEDELFDDINDNLQYLRRSAMTTPQQSLDSFSDSFPYGTWSFFRLLTEHYSDRTGTMPTLILDMWKQADGSAGAPDRYSVQAIDRVLRKRGSSLKVWLAKYGAANRKPAFFYDEARANSYPHSKVDGRTFLWPRKRRTPVFSKRMDHLTTATFRIRPTKRMRGKKWRLNVSVNMTPRYTGSAALIRIRKTSGQFGTRIVKLNRHGNGFQRVKFSRREVKWVEVTLANASRRYRCDRGTQYACRGESLDDFRKQKVRGYAVRRG